MHRIFLEKFIQSFKEAPQELILDFDATDDPVHGDQVGRFFHGYYDAYCFLPLYVFCQEQLLVSYLRESNQDGATHAWAILSLLVKSLRQPWPNVRIIFCGDSGFCRDKMLRWCERHDVGYIVGIPKNPAIISALPGITNEGGADLIKLIYKKSLADLPIKDFVVSSGYLKVATPELIAIDFAKISKTCRWDE